VPFAVPAMQSHISQLYAAFKKGKRTLQEVLNYIKGKADI
jgi:hypothetical protein